VSETDTTLTLWIRTLSKIGSTMWASPAPLAA
jgi:hypothetical protein